MSGVPEDWFVDSPSREDYFRYVAHKLIYVGYQFSLTQLEAGKGYEEPDITGFIRQGIRDYTFTKPGFDGFYPEENRPEISPSKSRIGKRRKMPDLVIHFAKFPRLELVCEAKRLNKNSSSDDYTDADGMGCFISGLYARDQSEVAMIGYVETQSVVYWKDILWEKIKANEIQLELMNSQKDIAFITEFLHEWQSHHRRGAIGQSVSIFHILLEYLK